METTIWFFQCFSELIGGYEDAVILQLKARAENQESWKPGSRIQISSPRHKKVGAVLQQTQSASQRRRVMVWSGGGWWHLNQRNDTVLDKSVGFIINIDDV